MDLKEIFIKNKCDKATKHRYYELYQQDFDKFKNDKINILEIGTFKGESTNAWLEYFSQAKIYTIDTFERVQAKDLPCLEDNRVCLLYTSPSPRDLDLSRMPSSA